MKLFNIQLITVLLFFQHVAFSQSFSTLFSSAQCGLNYAKASVLLTKRMSPSGFPYYGADQPAALAISGIPSSAVIERAYIWFDLAGKDTTMNVTITNPSLVTNTFTCVRTGGSNSQCSGKGAAFRADVKAIISGNGTYYISGLPTDSTGNLIVNSDVNGATLFIIFRDPGANFIGKMVIVDGYAKANNDTIAGTIGGITTIFDEDTSTGKAFMLVSEMQSKPATALQMHNGAFITPVQDFWDYEEKNAVFLWTVTTSVFGIRSPNDCCQLLMAGVYFTSPSHPLTPSFTRSSDILTASAGNSYQWYLNGVVIPGAVSQQYNASVSGTYHVIVFDEFGCAYSTDTMNIITCASLIKPNIKDSLSPSSGKYLLWTDSVSNSLQWYYNGITLIGQTGPSISAFSSGAYWVQANNQSGCIVNSDTKQILYSGIKFESATENNTVSIFPNPAGEFINAAVNGAITGEIEFKIFNITGQILYFNTTNDNFHNIPLRLFPAGIYALKVTGDGVNYTGKFVAK